MDVALELAGHSYEIGTWSFPPAKPNGHLRGEAMSIELPAVQTDLMRVHLLVLGRPEMDSTYTLAYRQAGDASTS